MTMRMPIQLDYTIHRSQPELISPARPTPYETKNLSALDDQEGHRCQFPLLHFYRNVAGMEGRNPVEVIKRAIAETLVYYYSFAGRLRDDLQDSKSVHLQELVHRSFFFGQEDIEILKKHVRRHIGNTCTRFDILTACLWRCRTISLKLDPNDEVRFGFFVDARAKFNKPIAVSTAGKLSESSLDYPMDFIKKAKAEVTDEFMRSSTIDLLPKRNKPDIKMFKPTMFQRP
ncbi:hypothetical protein ACHQM5_004870 [Ranunculus cassubicifolius]